MVAANVRLFTFVAGPQSDHHIALDTESERTVFITRKLCCSYRLGSATSSSERGNEGRPVSGSSTTQTVQAGRASGALVFW